jgi:hypothetical protein
MALSAGIKGRLVLVPAAISTGALPEPQLQVRQCVCTRHVHSGVGMKIKRHVTACFAVVVAASACAQSVPQPLNLKLLPESVPAESAPPAPAQSNNENAGAGTSAAADASNPTTEPAQMQPDAQYDGPYRMTENPGASAARKCDNATYTQPQIHGDVTAGVVAGNHVSGNYQSGVVNISKAFGSCDNPTGGVGISIGVGQGNFNGNRHGWH